MLRFDYSLSPTGMQRISFGTKSVAHKFRFTDVELLSANRLQRFQTLRFRLAFVPKNFQKSSNFSSFTSLTLIKQKIKIPYIVSINTRNTIYGILGWGSWIRKVRNSDCSPQAQSRHQRMTESEVGFLRKNPLFYSSKN